jgi:hypothetical protein
MLLIASGTAHADPPRVPIGIIGTVGLGGNSPSNDSDTTSRPDLAFSVKLDVGYRFDERLMVGFHGAFSSAVAEHESSTDSMFDTDYQYAFLPLQLGITGLYAVDDHTYVSGWAGIQRGWRRLACQTNMYNGMPGRPDDTTCADRPWSSFGGTTPAFGVSVGFDPWVGLDHRLTFGASVSYALASGANEYDQFSYATLAIEVGYRFWAN